MKKALLIWILGLVILVPYGTYYVLFEAQMKEYAFWIVGILFWIFGYWGIVGPLLSALKFRRVMKMLETIKSKDDLKKLVSGADNEEAIIDFIARENSVPFFMAKLFYNKMLKRVIQHI